MPLSVETYDRAEAEAEIFLPNRILESSRPEHFSKVGYPITVRSERALFNYIDVMHELRFARDIDMLLQGLTEEEFRLMREVTLTVARFSEERFGRRMIPKGALTRAIGIFRQIRILMPDTKATIVELGSGSGYLGALLGLCGYRFVANDVTQAFYLYQSHLWEWMFPDRFIELASRTERFTDLDNLAEGAIVHVPWWKYTVLDPENIRIPVDLVTANHALSEMHRDALGYTINLSQRWLSAPGPREKFFAFEGYGATNLRQGADVDKLLTDGGFTIALKDDCATILVPQSAYQPDPPPEPTKVPSAATAPVPPPLSPPPPQLTYDVGQARYFLNPRIAYLIARRSASVLLREGPRSLARRAKRFFQVMPSPVLNDRPAPPPVVVALTVDTPQPPASNPIARRVLAARNALKSGRRFNIEDVKRLHLEVMGTSEVWTDDERYWRFVYGLGYYG